jgi:hypothetical protein
VEHVAEGQENDWGTFQGCSRGGDGVMKNFTISELGDGGGYQKTITPSSLRYRQHQDNQRRREHASKPHTLLPRDHGCSFPAGHGMCLLW